ncbi:MAG: hypothetical protein LBG43_04675 [Treponema sp.]|nr:hypothetical protein [Treponema sp.]
MEGGVGLFANDSKDIWKTPLAYSAGFGCGFEFLVDRRSVCFFEAGVLFQFLGDEQFMVQKFGMGSRWHL